MDSWSKKITRRLVDLASAGLANVTFAELEEHVGLPVGIIFSAFDSQGDLIEDECLRYGYYARVDYRGGEVNGGAVVWFRSRPVNVEVRAA